jgi:peroxiredoxin
MVLMESKDILKKGSAAPNFHLKGVDGKFYSLDDFKNSLATVIIFMCNHCPYVRAKISTINNLYSEFSKKKVSFVGINPNNHPDYPEDSYENMILFAKENNINFPYLFDETQKTAKDYGAVCTPDPFVFDSNFKLFYHGRIDDVHYPSTKNPTSLDLADALNALLSNKEFNKKVYPSRGCSIKWRD